MKIVLAGSPQIAVRTFEKIIQNFEVVAIVTQPDRKKGRGMKFVSTPVAELAKKYNIKTFKPEKISQITNELRELNFDLFLTFAFGQWIPSSILTLGKYKPLNIHGSLLPKYRGAAPIHYAILNNDKEIGITLMEMIKEMDAGDMYFQAKQSIDEYTTTGQAFKIIDQLAFENIVNWLQKIEKNEVMPQKQNKNFTLSPKIDKSFGELSEILTIEEAIRKIRGLNPFPGAFIFKENKRIKIFDVVKKPQKDSIELQFSNGSIFAIDFQFEGKKRRKI